jgi:hypothetical protein
MNVSPEARRQFVDDAQDEKSVTDRLFWEGVGLLVQVRIAIREALKEMTAALKGDPEGTFDDE